MGRKAEPATRRPLSTAGRRRAACAAPRHTSLRWAIARDQAIAAGFNADHKAFDYWLENLGAKAPSLA